MNIYNLVLELLEKDARFRNSDKFLIWGVWNKLNLVSDNSIRLGNYLKAPSSESITRARRKVQEDYPHLQATQKVIEERAEKEETKGSFVHQESYI